MAAVARLGAQPPRVSAPQQELGDCPLASERPGARNTVRASKEVQKERGKKREGGKRGKGKDA